MFHALVFLSITYIVYDRRDICICRVVGDIFLQAYHSVFDYANLRIGFAEST